jgi:integrase
LKLKNVTLDVLKDYQCTRGEQVKGRPIICELGILVNVLREANLWYGPLKNYKRLPEGEEKVGNALTAKQKQLLEITAASKDAWRVAFLAFVIAVNTGMRGVEIKRLQLRHIDWNNRRLTIEHPKNRKVSRKVELNNTAFSAVTKLWVRAQQLGAPEPGHYLLPGDLSRHTKKMDPLRGIGGFDVTRHQESWDTAWRNLRTAAVDSIKA